MSARTTNEIGVCSWSLQPNSPDELAARTSVVGARNVQLALDPLREGGAWSLDATRSALDGAGIAIRSGMMGMAGEDYSTLDTIRTTGGVRPDATWSQNLEAARANAAIARELGLDLVSFHAGFLPEEAGAERTKLLERLRAIVDAFAEHGVRVAFETGQESATTLAAVLDELERPSAGVNFDPANMILYAMGDPVDAVDRLAPRVLQVHVKDAVSTKVPGTWGEEVRVGTGEVDWSAFFACLARHGSSVDLMIEREAGAERIDDIRAARELVERVLAEGVEA